MTNQTRSVYRHRPERATRLWNNKTYNCFKDQYIGTGQKERQDSGTTRLWNNKTYNCFKDQYIGTGQKERQGSGTTKLWNNKTYNYFKVSTSAQARKSDKTLEQQNL